MRILILIHEFPPIGGGGGRIAEGVARELTKRGHKLHVIAPYIKGLKLVSNIHGITVTRIPSFRRYFFRADLLAMFGYLVSGFFAGLWKIFRFRPDLIHVHFGVPAGALAWTLHLLTGVPYVLTSHLGDVPGGVPEKTQQWFRWIKPLTPPIWKDAAYVTAISEYTRQLAQSQYPVEIKLIHNGIKTTPSYNQDMVWNKPYQIVFAGRFAPQKNPDLIPIILNEIKDLQWQCIMIGDGVLRKKTEELITSFGLDKRVTFSGWLPPEQTSKIIAQSDILLLPSKSEGIPMVGLEALSAGLVVVASGIGGISDLIETGKNGVYCQIGDIQGYTQALRLFLSDREKLLKGRKSSLALAQKFDLQKVVDEYEKVFQDVLHKTGEKYKKTP